MPYKDESAFWRVRIPKGKNRHTQLKKTAKKLGITTPEALENALDNWLKANR